MVKFLKNGSLLALVEQPNWVYLQENGAYGLCDYENAQGVAINGIVYNLAGNLISENGEVDFKDIPSGEYSGAGRGMAGLLPNRTDDRPAPRRDLRPVMERLRRGHRDAEGVPNPPQPAEGRVHRR